MRKISKKLRASTGDDSSDSSSLSHSSSSTVSMSSFNSLVSDMSGRYSSSGGSSVKKNQKGCKKSFSKKIKKISIKNLFKKQSSDPAGPDATTSISTTITDTRNSMKINRMILPSISSETMNDIDDIPKWLQKRHQTYTGPVDIDEDSLYERMNSSIRVIQRNVRMYQAANYTKKIGAFTIQRNVRMYQAAREYQLKLKSVRILQKHCRSYQGRYKAANYMKKIGAFTIQRNVRMYQAAREYQLKLKSVRILQRYCRSYQGRRHTAQLCHNSDLMIGFEDEINMMLSFSY